MKTEPQVLYFKGYKRGMRKGRKLFSKANKADYSMKVMRKSYRVTMRRPFLNINPEDF
ncbi:MAG: hypothetical protein AB7T22_16630 [Calditrichaceae bacterium]